MFSAMTVAADLLSPIDCDGDPDCSGLEMVAGANIYSIDLDPFDGDGMEIKIQRDLNAMMPDMDFYDGYPYVADVDVDGVLDVLTVSRKGSEKGDLRLEQEWITGIFFLH